MLFHKKERGQGMVEYALIIFINCSCNYLSILTFFGEQLSSTYSSITSASSIDDKMIHISTKSPAIAGVFVLWGTLVRNMKK